MKEYKISRSDVLSIKGFITHVNEMTETGFIKHSLAEKKLSTNFSWDIKSGTKITTNAPDREGLANFLTYFRQVYSNDDRFSVRRLCNIVLVSKLLEEPYFSNVNTLKKEITEILKQKLDIQININNNVIAISNKDVIDLFINGKIFHSDKTDFETLSHVKTLEIYPFLWQLFINALVSISNRIFRIKNNFEKIDFDKLKNI